jgi:hypothetical protein
MKIVRVETLISRGSFPASQECKKRELEVEEAISKVVWPPGSDKFTIYPQSGKKSGEGNGVKPIKNDLVTHLKSLGWGNEAPAAFGGDKNPGDLDVVIFTDVGPYAVEWETGNISSSHRALNKMALGLLKGKLIGGVLIVPTRALYPYLTDRIGNWDELVPYFDLWRSINVENGTLQIIAVEHDATSFDVPKIPKGTDGRAKR